MGIGAGVFAGTMSVFAASKQMEAIPNSLNLTYRHQKFPVVAIKSISPDTKIISFGLGQGQEFHMDAAQTLQASVFCFDTKMRISRHYTPITINGTKEKFDVMVKKYEGGFMTPRLTSLEVGQGFEWSLVPPSFVYKRGMYDNMYMIAGGVGITPMLQLIRTVLADPQDTTNMKLLFCNKTEADILLKSELDQLQLDSPGRFKVTYALDRPPAGWTGEVGHTSGGMIMRALTPEPKEGDRMLVCGPDKMLQSVSGNPAQVMYFWSGKNRTQPTFQGVNNLGPVLGILGDLGWNTDNCWRF